MNQQDDLNKLRSILLFDACSYSRIAITELLFSMGGKVKSYGGLVDTYLTADSFNAVDGIIISVKGHLAQVVSTLQKIASWKYHMTDNCRVIILSDMSENCARFLLTFVGMLPKDLKVLWMIEDRITLPILKVKIKTILLNDIGISNLSLIDKKLSLKKAVSLMAILHEVAPLEQARRNDANIKCIYNNRSALLHDLSLSSLHVFYCGRFNHLKSVKSY